MSSGFSQLGKKSLGTQMWDITELCKSYLVAELHQQYRGRSTWKNVLGLIAIPWHIRWTDKLVLVETSPCICLRSVNSFGQVKLLLLGAPLCARGGCSEDPRVTGHRVKLHRIHCFGFTELIGVHYMAFWGKASITGLSLLLGGLLRP